MNTELSVFFTKTHPQGNEKLQSVLVSPNALPALLNATSTLLDAPENYGKSTLLFLAREQSRGRWLNVEFLIADSERDVLDTLIREITHKMWYHIEAHPQSLAELKSRAVAVRYFLDEFVEINTAFLLGCLAEDVPEHAPAIHAFLTQPTIELFDERASFSQKLTVLCDAVSRLGLEGVALWIEADQTLERIAPQTLLILQELYDSLYVTRHPQLYIKCLASPSICRYLSKNRGVETLSVERASLRWEPSQLLEIVERRIQAVRHHNILRLSDLIHVKQFTSFLSEFSDAGSPLEWITLTRHLLHQASETKSSLTEAQWLEARRNYCRERVPLWMDAQGTFWRGAREIVELTPRKRSIYPLVRYLYDNPGVHRTYRLMDKLGVEETNLNTIVSRARQLIEPFPTEADSLDDWLYLITDMRGGGYELQNTKKLS